MTTCFNPRVPPRTGSRVMTLGVLALLATVNLHAPPSARATVMVEVPLEDMARDAVAIVRGRVVHSGTHMVVRDGGIDPHTITSLEVTDWIKGQGGAVVQVRELGGLIGPGGQGGGMWIDGTPRYRIGEEVILFLRADPDDAAYFRTYAMSQGKFVVLRGVGGAPDVVARDTSTLAFARWARGRMSVHHGGREVMALEGFVDLVRGTLARFPSPGGVLEGGGR